MIMISENLQDCVQVVVLLYGLVIHKLPSIAVIGYHTPIAVVDGWKMVE